MCREFLLQGGKTTDDKTLLHALRKLKVETGVFACMGCGYEHDCGIHGCAIMREAAERIEGAAEKRGAAPEGATDNESVYALSRGWSMRALF